MGGFGLFPALFGLPRNRHGVLSQGHAALRYRPGAGASEDGQETLKNPIGSGLYGLLLK